MHQNHLARVNVSEKNFLLTMNLIKRKHIMEYLYAEELFFLLEGIMVLGLNIIAYCVILQIEI